MHILDCRKQDLKRLFEATTGNMNQPLKRFICFVQPEHFRKINDQTVQRSLFKNSVEVVEIEAFGKKHRSFSPNSNIDRIYQNQFMTEKLYKSIINDLAKIRYSKKINSNLPNEPLANETILERLRYARRKLPDATLHIDTNGDYLTLEYWEKFQAAGLNSIDIQVCFNKCSFIKEEVIDIIDKKMKNLGLDYYWTAKDADYIEAVASFSSLRVKMYGRDLSAYASVRGGLPNPGSKPRISPCLLPFNSFCVDLNGVAVPCCNFRSDAPELKGVGRWGQVDGVSIFEVYASEAACRWRRGLFNYARKTGPCAKCGLGVYARSRRNFAALYGLKVILTYRELKNNLATAKKYLRMSQP